MKSEYTLDKNIKRRCCPGSFTLDKHPGQKQSSCICRAGYNPGQSAFSAVTLDKTPDKHPGQKHYIYSYCLSRVCRPTSRHGHTPKDGATLRRRLQGEQHMTSKIFPAGGAV